jgi:hypothetical protein
MAKPIYGSLSKLVSVLFAQNSQDITLTPDSGTTYTAGRTIKLPAGDANCQIATLAGTETLTSKTLTTPTINGGTLTALTGLAIRDTSAAFDVTIAATSSSNLTAGRTLTLDMVNAARTVKLTGNLTLAADFITSGANSLTLTTTGSTNVTLPTSGTLATNAAATPSVAGLVTSFIPVAKSAYLLTTNANYTILDTDGYDTFFFSTGNTNRTCTLPTAANNTGRIFKIVKSDSGTGQVQIVGTVNGQSDSTLQNAINYQYGNCIITCDGSNYFYVQQIVEQGKYTPTGTNGANTSAWTMNANTQFMRIGNTVNISGVGTITISTANNVAWNISLPTGLAPTFGSAQQAGGCCINFGAGSGAGHNTALQAVAVNGNTIVQFATNEGNNLGSGVVNSFHFQYILA